MLRSKRARSSRSLVAAGIVEPVEAVEAPVDAVVEAAGEPEPEAFVTETMAELYLQQGHLEAALDIYQKLAEQRPGDDYLRERMLAVADAIHEASCRGRAGRGATRRMTPRRMTSIDDGSDEGAVLAGPTIREFLQGSSSRGSSSGPRRPSNARRRRCLPRR